MSVQMEALSVLLVATGFLLLGSSRIRGAVQIVAVQGVLLGGLTMAEWRHGLTAHLIVLTAGSMCLKGVLFPVLLGRAGREIEAEREPPPVVGYTLSVLSGVAALGIALWTARRLPLPGVPPAPLAVPVAFFLIFTGLLLVISRRTALGQVAGYLVLENGIYAFGVALLQEMPVLVEVGVLLDLFVAVFIMGITIFHIRRTFDHIDTRGLAELRD